MTNSVRASFIEEVIQAGHLMLNRRHTAQEGLRKVFQP